MINSYSFDYTHSPWNSSKTISRFPFLPLEYGHGPMDLPQAVVVVGLTLLTPQWRLTWRGQFSTLKNQWVVILKYGTGFCGICISWVPLKLINSMGNSNVNRLPSPYRKLCPPLPKKKKTWKMGQPQDLNKMDLRITNCLRSYCEYFRSFRLNLEVVDSARGASLFQWNWRCHLTGRKWHVLRHGIVGTVAQ